jgi:DNA mismatch endonuclease (patch repair protein)
MPKSNSDYWTKKLARNIERDKEVFECYKKKGWNIKRILEHEVKNDLEMVLVDLAEYILNAPDQVKKRPRGSL